MHMRPCVQLHMCTMCRSHAHTNTRTLERAHARARARTCARTHTHTCRQPSSQRVPSFRNRSWRCSSAFTGKRESQRGKEGREGGREGECEGWMDGGMAGGREGGKQLLMGLKPCTRYPRMYPESLNVPRLWILV